MSARLSLSLQSHGSESRGAPVRIEVLDHSMRRVAERWAETPGSVSLELEPGVYGVRVSMASGRHLDRVATVAEGPPTELSIPLFELSPHEGHEWAYFAHRIEEPSSNSLTDRLFEGAWLRLWERGDDGWHTVPVSEGDVQRLTDGKDGITYYFDPADYRPYLLQTGGQNIPWRCTALPPSHRIIVMIKPGAAEAGYPLDVAVSSENWGVQMLLSLLQAGDISAARSWDKEAGLAEQMLYGKIGDPAAAAVGGYFLLRIRDFDRLHDWANNLANWIDWMADGPVIHAWQLFAQADADPGARKDLLTLARARLLEADKRGVPLYTEGLRLLRDGLLSLYRISGGEDREVGEALARAGEYLTAHDPTMPTTTFLAEAPNLPDDTLRQGLPDDGGPMMFVFDVPVRELLRERLIDVGERLVVDLGEGLEAVVENDGILRLQDGRSFSTMADLEAEVGGGQTIPRWDWQVSARGQSLDNVADQLRRGTFLRAPEGGPGSPGGEGG